MKTYLVGGAIRDRLLGLEPKERDWVVVGTTPSEMKSKGFKQVGKDFPVFLLSNRRGIRLSQDREKIRSRIYRF